LTILLEFTPQTQELGRIWEKPGKLAKKARKIVNSIVNIDWLLTVRNCHLPRTGLTKTKNSQH